MITLPYTNSWHVFRILPQSPQKVPQLYHTRFLPNPRHFITHELSYQLLYTLRY